MTTITPLATLVMCTRNRPDQIDRALGAVAASIPPNCPVVIIDQSETGETERVIDRHREGFAALTYVRSASRGLSAGRNEGIRRSDTDVVLFTDDDCSVAPGWVEAWVRGIAARPGIGVAFGPVVGAAHDSDRGHIPTFEPGPGTHSHGLEIFRGGAGAVGMGASMAVRRQAWAAVGGFDERLGAGTPYRSAEDTDIAFRVARAGYRVGHVDTPPLLHHGVRAWEQVVRDNPTGLGAMHAKHIRCGDVYAGELLVLETWRSVRAALGRALRGQRPLKLRTLQQYHLAVMSSFEMPVDRSTRLYAARSKAC